MTTTEQQFSNRTLALVNPQAPIAREKDPLIRHGEQRDPDSDFLRFALEELDAMQQRVGELRFAIAAMTALIKDRLERA